jgi:hypothetical protein
MKNDLLSKRSGQQKQNNNNRNCEDKMKLFIRVAGEPVPARQARQRIQQPSIEVIPHEY